MQAMQAEFSDGKSAPEIDLNGEAEGTDSRIRYAANTPAAAIAPDAIAYDDSADFEGGSLIVEFTDGGTTDDQLQIVVPRFGEPLVYVIERELYFGDVVIGSITGGIDGSTPLVIKFYAQATPDVVQTVVRSIGYANLAKEAAEGERFVSFTLVDRDGNAGRAGATIDVFAAIAPEIDLNGDADGTDNSIKYVENGPATAIAPDAVVRDDSEYFDGGSLVVQFSDRSTTDDQLRIVEGKYGESPIYVVESDLYYRDEIIGTVTGGTDGSTPLLISFHGKVTAEMVQAVVRSVGYANFSQDPLEGERFVTFALFDRDGALSRAGATIHVIPVDTPGVAEDDTITTTEDRIGSGNLLDANGPGNDYDPDTPKLTIVAINGSQADVGQTITLKSGAKLTVNEDGSYRYDPDGQFDALADNESGAVNSFAVDSFQYTLADGATATVTVVVTGVAGPDDKLMGDDGGNTIKGAEHSDQFLLQQGGEDIARGGGGNDVIYVGAALSADDVFDGGAGRDAIVLQGNVTARLTDSNLVGIESISLQSGANIRFGDTANNFYDFDITTADGNVAAGQQLIVNAQSLRAGEDFTFDGSAETDGRFLVYGGHGVDDLTGGGGVDVFFFEGQRWGAGDKVDGGGGRDSLVISGGNGVTRILFEADSFTRIESISLNNRFATDASQKPSYELVLDNGNVAPGGTLIVNGSSIQAGQFVSVDGKAVQGGNLILFGGQGGDRLVGGAGADVLVGAAGRDSLAGGAGADSFRYDLAADSLAASRDEILDFQSGVDKIDLSRIDANSGAVGNQAFSWIGSNAFTNVAGQLRAFQSGGQWIVEGDTDGDGNADLVISVSTQGLRPLVQVDFQL